jgi:hypothetical protein
LGTAHERYTRQSATSSAASETVRDGAPVATERPFARPSESLAGFSIVDVESEARAIEIAALISKAADAAMEIRQCMDGPPGRKISEHRAGLRSPMSG